MAELNRAQLRQRERARARLLADMRRGMWPTSKLIAEAEADESGEASTMERLSSGWKVVLKEVALELEARWGMERVEEMRKAGKFTDAMDRGLAP